MNLKTLSGIALLSIFSSFASAEHCPLNKDQKAILEEAVRRGKLETAWVVSNSSEATLPERGFSRNLIGSSSAHTGIFTLIEQCTGPRTFDQFCEECEGDHCPTQRRCSQLGCEAKNIDTVRTWWEPAPFSYKTDQPDLPKYRVRYSNKPTTLFRFDGTTPDLLKMHWKASDRVMVRKNGKTYNVDSILEADAERTAEAPRFAHVKILYPNLVRAQSFIKVDFSINEVGHISGSISTPRRTLADIKEGASEDTLDINWAGACK